MARHRNLPENHNTIHDHALLTQKEASLVFRESLQLIRESMKAHAQHPLRYIVIGVSHEKRTTGYWMKQWIEERHAHLVAGLQRLYAKVDSFQKISVQD